MADTSLTSPGSRPRAAAGDQVLEGCITDLELAVQLHLNPRTLERWRRRGAGPPFVKAGRRVYYRVTTVREWLLERDRPTAP